jgi:hypothetical protein
MSDPYGTAEPLLTIGRYDGLISDSVGYPETVLTEAIRKRDCASRSGRWLCKPGLPPPATKSTATGNQPDDEEKYNRADGGVDDQADGSAPKMDA